MSRSKSNPTHGPYVRGHVPRERGGSSGVSFPFHRMNAKRTLEPRDARGLTRRELKKLEDHAGKGAKRDAGTYRAAKRSALHTGPNGGRTRTTTVAQPGRHSAYPQFLGKGFYVPAGPHVNLGKRPYRKGRHPSEAGYPKKYA